MYFINIFIEEKKLIFCAPIAAPIGFLGISINKLIKAVQFENPWSTISDLSHLD